MSNWFLYQQDDIPFALDSITLVCLNLSGSVNPQDDYVAWPVHRLVFNKQHKALGNWICVCPQAKWYGKAHAGPTELLPMTKKIELTLYTPWRKGGRGGAVEIQLLSLLIWTLDGSRQRSASAALPSATGTLCGGWVGPRASVRNGNEINLLPMPGIERTRYIGSSHPVFLFQYETIVKIWKLSDLKSMMSPSGPFRILYNWFN